MGIELTSWEPFGFSITKMLPRSHASIANTLATDTRQLPVAREGLSVSPVGSHGLRMWVLLLIHTKLEQTTPSQHIDPGWSSITADSPSKIPTLLVRSWRSLPQTKLQLQRHARSTDLATRDRNLTAAHTLQCSIG